jgi:hypothetical protein
MKVNKLRDLLSGIPDDFDVMIDGEYAREEINISYQFGYLFLHSSKQDDDEYREDD